MSARILRRAAAGAVSLLIVASLVAYADTVPGDGDSVAPGNQSMRDLGSASPGQVVAVPVTFSLVCGGLTHATPGSTITLTFDSAIVPGDGQADASGTTIAVPNNWISSGGCPSALTVPAASPVTVTLTMPSTAGDNQDFTVMWSRSGSGGLSGLSTLTFRIDVVGNTPPVLHLPPNQVAEATSASGAHVTFSASATDAQDSPAPAVTCDPASGSTFPLGPTTVQCSTTDSGGMKDTGTFTVTVRDTTAPTLANHADVDVTTGDRDGAAVTFTKPRADDAVDPSPTVDCSPRSGTTFEVGTTTVTCTATDADGNSSVKTFDVHVTYVPPVTWTAIWGEPVGRSGATLVANPGRTVPIKVEIFANGVRQATGAGNLAVATCDGTAATSTPLTSDGSRWTGHLDTGTIGAPGCYVATAMLDGGATASFRIDLRGATAAPVAKGTKGTKP